MLNREQRQTKQTASLRIGKALAAIIPITSALICVLIDYGMNRTLSWSLIVILSIGLFFIPAGIYSQTKNSGLTFFVFSLELITTLYLFEKTINQLINILPTYWFIEYALPISSIWLFIFWTSFLLRKAFKVYLPTVLGIVLLMGSVGAPLTNAIGNQESVYTRILHLDQILMTSLLIVLGIGCLAMKYFSRNHSR